MSRDREHQDTSCIGWWATSPLPGAIGVLHLQGRLIPILEELGVRIPEVGATTLGDVRGIDEAVIARTDVDSCLVMPHGGPRVRQLISEALVAIGVELRKSRSIPPRSAWPEARDPIEASMLEALAMTESPRAIPLLLAQPELHRRKPGGNDGDPERARALQHLLSPPLIGVTGHPNVGKSTLLNRLSGREVAITADLEGTTRDAVVSRILLDGIACEIADLPGRRSSDDRIEQRAIKLSDEFIRNADLLLLVVEDPDQSPPDLGREPDIVVLNKVDRQPPSVEFEGPAVSALTGSGIDQLAILMRQRLVPDVYLESSEPWPLRIGSDDRAHNPTIE